MIIPYWQARDLLVVDPDTGLQIEHVKAADPDARWVEVWATYEAAPGHKSLWLEEGGKTVERDYMLLRMTDMADGRVTYSSRVLYIDYDIVNKHSGLVVHEVRQVRAVAEDETPSDADTRP